MKQLFTATASIAICISLFSCADQSVTKNEDEARTESYTSSARKESGGNVSSFSKTVGAPIDTDKASRWIQNFEEKNGSASPTYNLKARAIASIISNKKCVGISLAYAVDPAKTLHVIPIGVDGNGKQIPAKYVYTERGNILWKTAWAWMSNYTGTVQSHFFGTNTFSRLWKDGVSDVLITFALDDNNNPQLLLTRNETAVSITAASTRSGFEDASFPCPPVCP